MARFDEIPLIDDHAHPMLLPATAAEPLVRYFTEGHDPETITHHAPHSLFYRHALRELADFLECEATAKAVMDARAAQPFDTYLRRLLSDAGVETVLLDDGYPRGGAMSVAQVGAAGRVRVRRILRIEQLLEDLIPHCDALVTLREAFIRELDRARPGLAALKSIIAYRTGLLIAPPTAAGLEEAERALAEVRASWGGEPGRLVSKPLLDYFVLVAAAWAARHSLPLQLHTGFGDRDLDVRLANPLHLRPLLEGAHTVSAFTAHRTGGAAMSEPQDGPLARLTGPLVLLHASYPYTREAAYLASVYPNVYVDISLAAPLLAGQGLVRVLEELLALAPVTKILYGSDAWAVPEWFWLAARAARRALAEALAWLPRNEQEWAAQRILHENALALYRLPLL